MEPGMGFTPLLHKTIDIYRKQITLTFAPYILSLYNFKREFNTDKNEKESVHTTNVVYPVF
jgi:hypothetical protein